MLFYMMLLVVASVFVAAGVLQWLWNITLPDVLGLKSVRYWQAFRLLMIAGLLFGSGNIIRLTA
jgi:hypothetical protein